MKKKFYLIERFLRIELKKAYGIDGKENDRVKEILRLLLYLSEIETEYYDSKKV